MKKNIKILGILNLTPDSFYDGGKYLNPEKALIQTRRMLDEGADIIDVGAYSSRPGAEPITEEEEEKRLLPVLKTLIREFPHTLFSVDTFRSTIARKAVEAGAGMINDISGGQMDKRMFKTAGALQVPYILMHMQGTPENMQHHPRYDDVVADINRFFSVKIKELQRAGVAEIILDPGFGFGKTIEHNYKILAGLDTFRIHGYPVLAGISRKSMLYKPLRITPDEALPATSAAHIVALLNGAEYLRVHDVKEARQVVEMYRLLVVSSQEYY